MHPGITVRIVQYRDRKGRNRNYALRFSKDLRSTLHCSPPQVSLKTLKPELLTQFPASNDENKFFFFENTRLLNIIILLTEHLPQTIFSISVTYYLVYHLLEIVYGRSR